MKISIVLPVKGRPKFLRQALLSILLQGHEDYEVVVQDAEVNGDPDSELQRICDLFGPRYLHRRERDGGIFAGTNLGLKRAIGDILYFMCSDDLLVPGALEAVNAVFEAEPFGGPFWVYGQTVSADVTGRQLGVDGEAVTYAQLLEHNRLGQPAVFWNRQLMALAGMFDPRYRHAADYDLWLRFWGYVEPVFLNQALGVHRHHDGQNTRVFAAATELEAKKISTRHQFLGPILRRARSEHQGRQAYATVAGTGILRDEDGWYGRVPEL